MKSKHLLGMKIHLAPYQDFLEQQMIDARSGFSSYTCVANVHMLIEAYRSPSFMEIVNNGNIITPDGLPLSWALKFLYGIRQVRVAGMDMLPDLLEMAEARGIHVGFYGGTPKMLDQTRAYINVKYAGLHIAKMVSPPFRILSAEEEFEIVKGFNEAGAQLIFVVLGCPKQEKWMASMQGRIDAAMIGIGGALPVLVGYHKRAPRWMQKAGLEWFFRLCQEPKRLFKRYAKTNSLFIYLIIKEKFRWRNQ